MNNTTLALLLLSMSTSVMAQNLTKAEQHQVDNQMQQMTRVHEDSAIIMIDENSSYVSIEYVGEWTEINNYVSHDEANALQLQKVGKKFVYSQTGDSLEYLEQKLMEHIEKDRPSYFSVDVYRDYHGDSGEFNYLARVIEYK
ncbi:hypothetical protein AB6D20_018210 [Vibrio splendidus]